ncbi:MAG: primase C-terminal domain-containing protein [Nitrosopumilus sp.]|nr:primase C-terminal domain-containing protein [Nitrosopumilus sp.]
MNLREETTTSLREQGLRVFPLRDKRPAGSNWQNYEGEVTEEQSFGIVLGRESKIFVIDVDDYSLFPNFTQFLDKTYIVKTGEGFHIFVKADTIPQTMRLDNNQSQHIDIQSTGTYVVGETSEHYEKNLNGVYVKTGKIYEKISDTRNINYVDYETEIKPILKKLGFDLAKKPIKEELSDSIKNGVPKGNRNNTLFKLSCNVLKSIKDTEIAFNHISTINEKSKEPLDAQELVKLFKSATTYVNDETLESNKKFKISDRIQYELLDESPKELRAITLDEDKTRLILVYLPTKITENGINTFDSKAYFVTNGTEGKKILPIDDPILKKKYVTSIFSSFKTLNDKWKNKDVQEYIQSNDKVNPKQVFDNLYKMETTYFENEFDYDYHFQSCWITHTYFYTLFDLTPYNDYFGMKNVGKSKRLNFLRITTYNGILSGDSSISSIFRTIQGTGATLLLDETESLKGGKDDRTDLENLLRNGFSKEGMVIRSKETKKREFTPEFFSVYSPKAFGHINGFDNVLDDRCIKTKLVRTINKNIADSEPDEKEDQLIYKTRESLYRLFLDYADEIHDLIPEAKSLIKEQSGREMKLWLPIITMALFYQNHGVEGLIDKIMAKILLTSEDKKISDIEDNNDFKILQILEQAATIPTTSKQLYNFINDDLARQFNLERLGDKIIKESLERLGFRNKRTSKSVEWVNLTSEKIQEAKERVGLIQPTQTTLFDNYSTNKM